MRLVALVTLAAMCVTACAVEVGFSGNNKPNAGGAWSPQTFSAAGDLQTDDFYIGDDKWSLCLSLDAVDPSRTSGTGRVFVIVKESVPPHYFRASSEVVGGDGAGKCTLIRTPPGRYYLIVSGQGAWTVSAGRAP